MIIRVIKLFTLLLLVGYSGFAQAQLGCGTIANERDIQALESFQDARNFDVMSEGELIYIAITPHIVRRSDGTGGLEIGTLEQAMIYLNESYEGTTMRFFILGDVRYIDSDDYFDFDSSNEAAITSPNNVPNTINIYFYNSLTSQGSALCGYAYFPETRRDHIMMANACTDASTFPHELGHYFALYHTHGKSNTGTTDELVDGSNCTTNGDDVCDTAADPNLTGLVSSLCEYTGSGLDTNNDVFAPNPRNFMSYSSQNCRELFTEGQKARALAAYQQFKTHLIVKDFIANFEVQSPIVCEGEEIAFQNRSIGAISYLWEFEGGTPSSSTEKDPIIIYSTGGTFDVTLTIMGSGLTASQKELADNIVVRIPEASSITEDSGSFEEETIEEEILNEDNTVTFEKSNKSSDGSSSVFIEFMDYPSVGAEDYLVFANLNTQVQKFFELTFDYAYAPYDELFSDGLAVVYRESCGEWITVWEKSGTELQTSSAQQTLFRPDEDQWKAEQVEFEIPDQFANVEFAFKSVNGFGNALYLDNYNVYVNDPTFDISDVVVNDASCSDVADGSLTINALGTKELQYSLNDGEYGASNVFSDLMPGEYTGNVKSESGFVKSELITVGSVNEYPPAQNIVFLGDFLTINTVPGQSVQWYLNNTLLEGENSSSLTNPQRGSYTVAVSNGACAITSSPFIILSTEESLGDLELYPNPASSQLQISLPSNLQKKVRFVRVKDLTGKNLKTYTKYEPFVDVRSLKSGLYFIEIGGDSFQTSKRFFKR